MTDPKCKKCRRAGQKLFLKGERCFGQKCAIVRKPYIPGAHGKARMRRISEYGQQLAEKQKIRHIYGVSERQFKNYFKAIVGQRGNREELLAQKLEKRLDNIVFRLGWASSRKASRQIVNHGHILVNGRKVDIPSYQVKKGDVIKIREKSKKLNLFKNIKSILKKHEVVAWLTSDAQKIEGKVKSHPGVEDLDKIGELSMVIEYYSR